MRSIRLAAVAVMVLCFAMVTPAFGVISHADDEPPVNWAGKPSDAVLGQWRDNSASCVAVGYSDWTTTNYIVTTRHQGWGVGSSVWLGGVEYKAAEIFVPEDYGYEKADLRVVRLTTLGGGPANLSDFVTTYTGAYTSGISFVMGGFGRGRGADLMDGAKLYGYAWSTGDDQQQLWGQNAFNSTQENVPCTGAGGIAYTSDVIVADFDGTAGVGGYVVYEAAPAEWDSGGGWFIKVGDEWQLAAISAYPEHSGQTWFNDPNTPSLDPDWFMGIRIGDYAGFVNTVIPEPGTMILLTLGAIGLLRRRR